MSVPIFVVVGTPETADTKPDAGRSPAPLPVTLDWHRDLAKWMVAAAAAIISLGLTYFGEATESALRGLFTAAGVVLLLSLASGTALHFWVVELGKLWEQRGQIPKDKKIALDENTLARTQYTGRAHVAYRVMLVSFVIGVCIFGAACLVRMWSTEQKTGFTFATGDHGQLYLVEASTGETWIAVRNEKGELEWKRAIRKLSTRSR